MPYPLGTAEDLAATVDAAVASGASSGGTAHAYQGDVRDVAAMADAVAYAEHTFGGLDAAIACAGVIAGGAPQWQLPLEQERAVLDVDLGGVLNLARAAVPALLRRPEPRSGRFLAVASAAATRGLPMLAAYCAAKAGVTGLIRALAVELGQSGVTANAVSPGSTDTEALVESARLYGLLEASSFAAAAADAPTAPTGRDRRRAGLPRRPAQLRDDRSGRARRRRSRAMTLTAMPVPIGFRMVLDADTKRVDDSTLFGGSPARIMRLTETGRARWTNCSPNRSAPAPPAGWHAACPMPASCIRTHLRSSAPVDATVIIPDRDRPDLLARCLDALGSAYPVLVVDDASTQPERIAEVCATHGAALVRREVNGGPGAARNTGLAHTSSEIIVFLDSDCVPPADLVDRLAAHLADPLVGRGRAAHRRHRVRHLGGPDMHVRAAASTSVTVQRG